MKVLILAKAIFLLLSCVSVNVELEPNLENTTSFVHYSHYGLFGLIGNNTLDIKRACINGKPVKIENYFSFEDFLFTMTSIGFYTPKSTKVWCELTDKNSEINL